MCFYFYNSVPYQSDDESGTARVITNENAQEQKNTSSKATATMKPDMPIDTGKMDDQQSTSSTTHSVYETMQNVGEKEHGFDELGSLLGEMTLDDQIYITTT